MIEIDAFDALKTYTVQTHLFLGYVRSRYPELSEGEVIQLATETLRKLVQLLSQHEPPSKDIKA